MPLKEVNINKVAKGVKEQTRIIEEPWCRVIGSTWPEIGHRLGNSILPN